MAKLPPYSENGKSLPVFVLNIILCAVFILLSLILVVDAGKKVVFKGRLKFVMNSFLLLAIVEIVLLASTSNYRFYIVTSLWLFLLLIESQWQIQDALFRRLHVFGASPKAKAYIVIAIIFFGIVTLVTYNRFVIFFYFDVLYLFLAYVVFKNYEAVYILGDEGIERGFAKMFKVWTFAFFLSFVLWVVYYSFWFSLEKSELFFVVMQGLNVFLSFILTLFTMLILSPSLDWFPRTRPV